MIGPSDLNRIPRWIPGRLPDDFRRYARSELGAEVLRVPPATRPSGEFRGFRAWLAGRLRPTRTAVRASGPSSLRTGAAAVHFSGETGEPQHEMPAPLAVFATPALAFTQPAKDTGSDDRGACDL